jgi:hypothetical protein
MQVPAGWPAGRQAGRLTRARTRARAAEANDDEFILGTNYCRMS